VADEIETTTGDEANAELAARVAKAAQGETDARRAETVETNRQAVDTDTDEERAARAAAAKRAGFDADLGDVVEDLADDPDADGPREEVEPTAVEPAKPERKATRYVVLQSVAVKISGEEVEMFRRVGDDDTLFAGPDPRQLESAADLLESEGRHLGGRPLVAVPERSWKPKEPKEKPRPPVRSWE
jgi:hypothetical protein